MNTSKLRKVASPDGLPVSYGDEVTKEQVRRIDDLVSDEFKYGKWVTVEQES